MLNLDNHWSLCDKSGAVFYDEYGRAHIYDTREAARQASSQLPKEKLHVEKVEIK